jgi:DNA-binding NtrC family response regulator
VYGIVRQSDGWITVQSEVGKGTTFEIFLPLVEEAVQEPERAQPAVSARGTETILLVEDDGAVRELAIVALQRQGYRVLSAANGGEALLQLEEYRDPVHLVLTDVVMPRMGGTELVERLGRLRPEMRVLFMSGYADRPLARDRALLEKPFTPDGLVRKVREVLDAPARV